MSDHTSGPWTADIAEAGQHGWRTVYVRDAQREILAILRQSRNEETSARMMADTRLMAAAPELLAVAQFLLSIGHDLRQRQCQCDEAYCAYCAWLDDAQAAVNKALGTTEGATP